MVRDLHAGLMHIPNFFDDEYMFDRFIEMVGETKLIERVVPLCNMCET